MKKWIKYILPLIYLFYAGSISLCYHTHVVDGIRITHSHPYSSDNDQTHTEAEFELIYSITATNFTDYVPHFIDIPFFGVLLQYFETPQQIAFRSEEHFNSNPLRGPPSLFNV